jgi:hypothetical protein
MTTLTLERATDEQIKQLARVASDAAEKAVNDYFKRVDVSKGGAQRVHGNGDFAARVREGAILALADLSVTDKYKDEEVSSKYGYLSGYKKPEDVIEQTNLLRQLFPGVGFADENMARPVVANAEGYFAIPRWQSIAPTYGETVQKVLDALNKAYKGKFKNWREGQLGQGQLRQSAKSAAAWEQIGETQKGFDILLVPAQFGLRHRGRSVRRAREVMERNEFGLGAFAVGIMLLTHADRLRHYDDLYADCAGDEFHDPRRSGAPFVRAPIFSFSVEKLKFDAGWSGIAGGRYGSASGWAVPQQ